MKTPSPSEHESNAIVVIGKLGRPYGVRGWLALQSFTDPAGNILTYQPWCIQSGQNSDWVKVADFQAKPHNDGFIAQINGIEDRDEAAGLTGSFIGVSRQAIDALEEDEYLWHDLIGCNVTNLQGVEVGIVRELMETGAHAVLCITPSDHWRKSLTPAPAPAPVGDEEQTGKDTKSPLDPARATGQQSKTAKKKPPASVLVPFTGAYVQTVDTKNKQLVVDWQADWA